MTDKAIEDGVVVTKEELRQAQRKQREIIEQEVKAYLDPNERFT